jgi:hypothetical protein
LTQSLIEPLLQAEVATFWPVPTGSSTVDSIVDLGLVRPRLALRSASTAGAQPLTSGRYVNIRRRREAEMAKKSKKSKKDKKGKKK